MHVNLYIQERHGTSQMRRSSQSVQNHHGTKLEKTSFYHHFRNYSGRRDDGCWVLGFSISTSASDRRFSKGSSSFFGSMQLSS